jgi:hypothetical protein
MVSRIHTYQRRPGLGTSLLLVCHVRLRLSRCINNSTAGGMYEDVSAVTKVSLTSNVHACAYPSRNQGWKTNPVRCFSFPQHRTERLKRMLRSTLIPSSTSPVTRSRLGRLMYFRCLFRAPRRGELRGGHIMKMTKTSRKVRSFYIAYTEALYRVSRRHGTRHLGSRPAQLTVS